MRVPRSPRITAAARSAQNAPERSSDGSAWHTDPPIVPRLRTIASAMLRSASRSTGATAPTSDDARSSAWRVIAPMRSSPSSTATKARSVRSLMSTSSSGATSRSFIIGMRLCPPATRRVSGP